MPSVEGFQWDDQNEEKVYGHGLLPDSVDQVLENPHAVFSNRRSGSAPYQVIGVDHGGAFITVIIDAVPGDDLIWRPRTAWHSKASEIARARKQGVKS